MTRKEIIVRYREVLQTSNETVDKFDTDFDLVYDLSLTHYIVGKSVRMKLDEQHRMLTHHFIFKDGLIETVQRKIDWPDGYDLKNIASRILLDGKEYVFDALHDSIDSSETVYKLQCVKEHIRMLEDLHKLEKI